MRKIETLELIERIGNLLKTEQRKTGAKYNLLPVHIQVLSYLNRCNRYSNTPAGVVKYFGITKGTASQSIKVLERQSLISKEQNPDDRRSIHLLITLKGKQILKRLFAVRRWDQLLNTLNDETITTLSGSLKKVLMNIQKQNSYKTFGVCKTCRHLLIEQNSQFRCGLTKEKLSANDTTKICHEHEFSKAI